eukprot:TRINITY_DN24466_c0_g2_i1.p1 TRINITY_DN24466_c0_g2~~TRINITY_DN24466_c0_g2_i1.p1  ORF type:complete len:374 (-),score=74.01 TRINITY_DN24466_c0_g2_i1:32-1153(-)
MRPARRGAAASSSSRSRLATWLLRLCAVLSWQVAQGQVRNLRFIDEDTDAGQISGIVYWEAPASSGYSLPGFRWYYVFLCQDAAGTGPTAIGDVVIGAYTSEIRVPANTAIAGPGFTHIGVKYKQPDGTINDASLVTVKIFDNPVARRFYVTCLGRTKADGARTALITNEYAQAPHVRFEMVASAVEDGTTSVGLTKVAETTFDEDEESESVTFQIIFDSSNTVAEVETLLASFIDDSPVPVFFTGTASSAAHKLAAVQVNSVYDDFVPIVPDTDKGRHLLWSGVTYSLIYAGTVNLFGEARMLTTTVASSPTSTAVQDLVDVYMGYNTAAFTDVGGSAATLTAIMTHATAASGAECQQISNDVMHLSCVYPV